MSFGGGIHYCIGAPLARLETQVAFPALLNRYPKLQVAEGAERRASLTLRGYTKLPIIADCGKGSSTSDPASRVIPPPAGRESRWIV